MDVETGGIIIPWQGKTMALIRLPECATDLHLRFLHIVQLAGFLMQMLLLYHKKFKSVSCLCS